MKRILFILLLNMGCIHPMQRENSLADLKKPLLEESSIQPKSQAFLDKLKHLASAICSRSGSEAHTKESPHASPRESIATDDITITGDMLQHYGQRSCSALRKDPNTNILIQAHASAPTDADFTCIRKNLHWHIMKDEELKPLELYTLHTSIGGKAEIDCFDGKPRLSCCIFTSCEISTIALDAKGKKLAIAGYEDSKHILLIYRIYHKTGSKKLRSYQAPHLPFLLAFSPSGKRILMCCLRDQASRIGECYARVFSLKLGKVETELAEFNELQLVQDLQCGWLNENEIIAIDGLNNTYKWNLISEPAGE